MSKKHIGICHRNPLFSECLATSLLGKGDLGCRLVQPDLPVPITTSDTPLELLLLDVSLANEMADHVAAVVRIQSPGCRLLLLVADSAVDSMVELARFGSHGYLFEEVSLASVIAAIETVLAGRPFCSPELANALMAHIGRIDRGNPWIQHVDDAQLTSREQEVLELIAWENLGNKQIARRLGVSLYTIKNHVHDIIEKLGVHDRHEAVQHARRRKLLLTENSDAHESTPARLPR